MAGQSFLLTLTLAAMPLAFFACSVAPPPPDGKTYKTVKIGTQTWMAENLNYEIKTSRCYGDRDGGDSQGYCAKYGRLYNGGTATRVCPQGWRLPRVKDWITLFRFAAGCTQSECSIGAREATEHLKAASGWDNDAGNGTDYYGFSALPGGYYSSGFSGRSFRNAGFCGIWWISDGGYVEMGNCGGKSLYWSGYRLFSVRCVKDYSE